jgi:alpha-mannosidase
MPPVNAPSFTPIEAAIRKRLGIPDTATQVLVMGQSSHLDWDWKISFPELYYQDGQPVLQGGYWDNSNPGQGPTYYNEPASAILQAAARALADPSDPAYYYAICEMAFVRAFCNDERFAYESNLLRGAGNFQILGGGITSPDNLLAHGEAFIRNYLSGWAFVSRTFATPPRLQCWLPDDFGHDSQLPALLAAMGMQGVGFGRVPGDGFGPVDGTDSVEVQLEQSGLDFFWTADDGSRVLAHWMIDRYCQGDNILNCGVDPDQQKTPDGWIASYLALDATAKQNTPYLFLPVGCDFRMPQRLPSLCAAWNADPLSPVYAVAATFDDFMQLTNAHADALPVQPMYATPYWTGCYAMRPAIKRGHNEVTRTLLAAEAFERLLQGAYYAPLIASTWDDLAPTTHHDFIPGSASVVVYRGEQQPILDSLVGASQSALGKVLEAVIPAIDSSPQAGERPFAVFNSLGAEVEQLIEIPDWLGPFGEYASVRVDGDLVPIQISATGTLLFRAVLPSLGYKVFYLSPYPPTIAIVPATVSGDGNAYTLANGHVSATLEEAQSCNLTVVNDLDGGDPAANLLGGPANLIRIYSDTGDNYAFGCEGKDATGFQQLATPTGGTANVVEAGPLRCTVATDVTYTDPYNRTYTYRRTYAVVAGEALLRMTLTGAAPLLPPDTSLKLGYAVVVESPLAQQIAGIAQGTAAHWTGRTQVFYWKDAPSFQPTHDWVIANGAAGPLAAIYHGSVPAWGLNAFGGTNVLAGCLLRNTYPTYNELDDEPVFEWGGTDPESHTLEYALRMPSGIPDPASGVPTREARTYSTAPYATSVSGASGTLPAVLSLAGVAGADAGQPIVAALKAGTWDDNATFIRVYDPSNVPGNRVALDLNGLIAAQGGGPMTVQIVTALEQPIDGEYPQPYTSPFVVATRGAYTTLKVALATR